MNELMELKTLIGLDCGDHSCRFAISRTGMRTNGGCRCHETLQNMKDDAGRWNKLKRLSDTNLWGVRRFVFDKNGQSGKWTVIDRDDMNKVLDMDGTY